MGKRSFGQFERKPRDFYPTPAVAVQPLLRFLPPATRFAEPCAGDGALIRALEAAGHVCVDAADIAPRGPGIRQQDAMDFICDEAALYITNPPWSRDILHPLIAHLSAHRPTWLLIDANWLFTKQAARLLPICSKIVTIGRVKWIPGTKMTGKDDAIWANFDARLDGPTEFFGKC